MPHVRSQQSSPLGGFCSLDRLRATFSVSSSLASSFLPVVTEPRELPVGARGPGAE